MTMNTLNMVYTLSLKNNIWYMGWLFVGSTTKELSNMQFVDDN